MINSEGEYENEENNRIDSDAGDNDGLHGRDSGGILRGFGCFLTINVGTVAVHVYLADVACHTLTVKGLHQIFRSLPVDRRENDRTRGRAVLYVIDEYVVCLFRVFDVRVSALLRKCDRIEPVQKLQIHAESPVRVLRRMQMDVGHARTYQLVRIVKYLDPGIFFGQLPVYARCLAVLADQVRILVKLQLGKCLRETDVSL